MKIIKEYEDRLDVIEKVCNIIDEAINVLALYDEDHFDDAITYLASAKESLNEDGEKLERVLGIDQHDDV